MKIEADSNDITEHPHDGPSDVEEMTREVHYLKGLIDENCTD